MTVGMALHRLGDAFDLDLTKPVKLKFASLRPYNFGRHGVHSEQTHGNVSM